jgi:hypothetical protein
MSHWIRPMRTKMSEMYDGACRVEKTFTAMERLQSDEENVLGCMLI